MSPSARALFSIVSLDSKQLGGDSSRGETYLVSVLIRLEPAGEVAATLLLVVLDVLLEVLAVDLVNSLSVLRQGLLADLLCDLLLLVEARLDAFACVLVWLFFHSRETMPKIRCQCHHSQPSL